MKIIQTITFAGLCIPLAASILIASTQISRASYCDRHIYNQSPNLVTVRVTGEGQWSADIKPGKTLAVQYHNDVKSIYIRHDNTSSIYEFSGWGEAFKKSCYWKHNGRTGSVILNEPANGDIIVRDLYVTQ